MQVFLLFVLFSSSLLAATKRYELHATRESVNMSGKKEVSFALMLNKSIPAPTLEFIEGDDAEITVHNDIPDEELSIHWHGLLLDPYMDGVPYLNTPPIFPGQSFTFRFQLRQSGTYWYHSHTNIQEQKGLYGPIIIHPKKKQYDYNHDLIVMISDWSDEDAAQILKNLRKDGDYYVFKKGTMRSWWGAIRAGSLKNFLQNEWTRMGGMDFSDVGYDAFLINGKKESQGLVVHPGDKVRLRVINAAASTYFYLTLGQRPMNIISIDGIDVKPTLAKEILIGMAESYDILFEVPEHKNFEFKATAQDGTGSTSLWIGMATKEYAPVKPFPDMYALMDHSSHDQHPGHDEPTPASQLTLVAEDHSHHQHHAEVQSPQGPVNRLFDVSMAEAKGTTAFPARLPRYDVKLVLDGDMDRYIWHINGKTLQQDKVIEIKKDEVVRFTFVNKTMMHHPMHLHGHFFRVLNQHGEKSPLKHTVDVPPHSERTIEFYTNEPGEWMLHCHNLYHMKTGMGRVVKYSSFTPRKEILEWQKKDPHNHDHYYYRGMIEAATNHAQAQLNIMNTWNEFELRAELRNDFSWEGEGDLFYKRWFNRFFNLVAGGTFVRDEGAVVAGFGYLLPFLIETHTLIDHQGRLRVDVEKRFQWTKYIYTDAEFTFRQKQDSEFEISLMYQRDWSWSAGLMFTEKSAGIGAQYNF